MTVLTYPHVPAVGTIPVGLDASTGLPFDLPYRDHTLIVGGTLAGKTSVLGLYAAGVASKPDVALAIIDGEQSGIELTGFKPRATWFAQSARAAARTLDDIYTVRDMRLRLLLEAGEKRWTGNQILLLVDGYASLAPEARVMVGKLLRYRFLGIHVVITARPSQVVSEYLPTIVRENIDRVLVLDAVGRATPREYLRGRLRVPFDADEADYRVHLQDGAAFDRFVLSDQRAASIGTAFASYRIPLAKV